jgi:hypothetical protein
MSFTCFSPHFEDRCQHARMSEKIVFIFTKTSAGSPQCSCLSFCQCFASSHKLDYVLFLSDLMKSAQGPLSGKASEMVL